MGSRDLDKLLSVTDDPLPMRNPPENAKLKPIRPSMPAKRRTVTTEKPSIRSRTEKITIPSIMLNRIRVLPETLFFPNALSTVMSALPVSVNRCLVYNRGTLFTRQVKPKWSCPIWPNHGNVRFTNHLDPFIVCCFMYARDLLPSLGGSPPFLTPSHSRVSCCRQQQ